MKSTLYKLSSDALYNSVIMAPYIRLIYYTSRTKVSHISPLYLLTNNPVKSVKKGNFTEQGFDF